MNNSQDLFLFSFNSCNWSESISIIFASVKSKDFPVYSLRFSCYVFKRHIPFINRVIWLVFQSWWTFKKDAEHLRFFRLILNRVWLEFDYSYIYYINILMYIKLDILLPPLCHCTINIKPSTMQYVLVMNRYSLWVPYINMKIWIGLCWERNGSILNVQVNVDRYCFVAVFFLHIYNNFHILQSALLY